MTIKYSMIPSSMTIEQSRRVRRVEEDIALENAGVILDDNPVIAELQREVFVLKDRLENHISRTVDDGGP